MRGVVSAEQLVMALMDSGTLPVVGRLHHQMMSAYANHASKLIVFRFPDFIEQVDCIRKEEKAIREAAFRSWYTIHKWSDENKILTSDMAQLIMDLALVSDSCRNVQDVRLLVDDVRREASESLYLGSTSVLTSMQIFLKSNAGWKGTKRSSPRLNQTVFGSRDATDGQFIWLPVALKHWPRNMDAAIELTGKVVETARVQARRREAMVADQVGIP